MMLSYNILLGKLKYYRLQMLYNVKKYYVNAAIFINKNKKLGSNRALFKHLRYSDFS